MGYGKAKTPSDEKKLQKILESKGEELLMERIDDKCFEEEKKRPPEKQTENVNMENEPLPKRKESSPPPQ